uniref:Uncharacterized protein n=1 Tax=Sphenodon punctatus TaxID=8508 RepID=A0A8D0GKH5_SPHPU
MGPLQEAEEDNSVILISDDEADNTFGSSVLLVEPLDHSVQEGKKTEEVVDEEREVVVLFCKKAKVMPHARYDCTTHPFVRAEFDRCSPLERNADTCGQCYCYICDKLTSECKYWTTPSLCHCNAHNKSKYWKEQRDFALAGILVMFNLELAEIDEDLRYGGSCLIKFTQELSVEYNKYLVGEKMPPNLYECFCTIKLLPGHCGTCRRYQNEIIHRYTPVYDLVTAFIREAEGKNPKSVAVMLLGAAKEIALHKDPASSWQNLGMFTSVKTAVPDLMARITRELQRLLVLSEFPKTLYEKFISFFQSISLPSHCYVFSNSLNIVPWDHGLLTTVLKGQNITGERREKGKKVFLWEAISVIQARVEKMEDRQQYRELVRYLKAVKCTDTQVLREFKDTIPFYMCKIGDFASASQTLLVSIKSIACCTACRLSPLQFEMYLKMFQTGHVPMGKGFFDTPHWGSAGVPMKPSNLLKQVLKLFYSSQSLYRNPKCWSALIRTLGSSSVLGKDGQLIPLFLKEPSQEFKQLVLDSSYGILKEFKTKSHVFLPPHIFGTLLHLEAGLILMVQGVKQMIRSDLSWLTSFLEIILAFGNNLWALRLLFDTLSYEEMVLQNVVTLLLRDFNLQKLAIINWWKNLGPQYVGEWLYLTCKRWQTRPLGIATINIIKDNLDKCPWSKELGNFLQNKGLRKMSSAVVTCPEVVTFIALLEKL